MRIVYQTLKVFLYTILITFLLLGSSAIFLLGTTTGLWTSTKLVSLLLPGQLRIHGVKGRIFNHIAFKDVSYIDQDLNLNIHHLDLNWQLIHLFKRQLVVNNLQASQVNINNTTPVLKSETVSPMQSSLAQLNLPKLPLDIQIHQVNIQQVIFKQDKASNEIKNIQLQASLTNKQWQFTQLKLTSQGHTIQSNAVINVITPYAINALAQIQPEYLSKTGLHGKVQLNGDFLHYYLVGKFTNPTPITINGELTHGTKLQLTGKWDKLAWPINEDYQFISQPGQFKVTGTLPDLTISLTGKIDQPLAATLQIQASTNAHGGQADAIILAKAGNINLKLSVDKNQTPYLKGSLKAQLTNADEKFALPIKQIQTDSHFSGQSLSTLSLYSQLTGRYNENPIDFIIRYNQQALNASVNLGPNHLQVNGSLLFPWHVKASIPQPGLLHPYLNGLNTSITAEANLVNEQQGNLTVSISKGEFKNPEFSRLQFQGGNLVAILDKQQLQTTGNLNLDEAKNLLLTLSLPHFNYLKGDLQQQKIQGNLKLMINSLAFLNDLSPQINHVQGQLGANLKVSGTVGKPAVEGEIQLTKASVSVPSLGIELNPLQLTLLSRNKKWQAEGEFFSKGTPLLINGNGELAPFKGMVTVKGEQVSLINNKEYAIDVSPNLTFEFTPSNLKMRGLVLIPKAVIKPQTFANSVSLTDDVVYVDKQETTNPFNIDTDIKIAMGDNVLLTVKGLQGSLTGALNIRQFPQGPLTATGELNVKNGKYQAYGQDLTIEKGQLLFTGGLIDNPAIQVQAVRKFNNVANNTLTGSNHLFDFNSTNAQTLDFGKQTTVGIKVNGRLSNPKVQLFSVPSTLSQADILSMLLLGRPADQAGKSGAQLILAAVSALNLDSAQGGTQLLSQLKQNLGIDISLENNIQYDQKTNQSTDKNSVVISKSLSKRLSLNYNVGLSKTDTNVLTLKYLLNKFFSVQVNASTAGKGIDLFYTHQKE